MDSDTAILRRSRARDKAAALSVLSVTLTVASIILLLLVVGSCQILMVEGYHEGQAQATAGLVLLAITFALSANRLAHWKMRILREAGYGLQSLLKIADEVIKNELDYIEFEKNGRRIYANECAVPVYIGYQGQPAYLGRTSIRVTHNAKIPAVMGVGYFGRSFAPRVELFNVDAYLAWKNTNPSDIRAVPKKVRLSRMSEESTAWAEAKAHDIFDSFCLSHGEELVCVEPRQVFCLLKGAPTKLEPWFLAEAVGRLTDLAAHIEAQL